MKKMIKKVTAYKWKCPYCYEDGMAEDYDDANTILHDHMIDCACNPANMQCHSCIHKKGEKCERYNMNWLSAYILRQDVDYNCFSWECRDRLKKIQEKLNKEEL